MNNFIQCTILIAAFCAYCIGVCYLADLNLNLTF